MSEDIFDNMIAIPLEDNGEHFATIDPESDVYGAEVSTFQPAFCEVWFYQYSSQALTDLDAQIATQSTLVDELTDKVKGSANVTHNGSRFAHRMYAGRLAHAEWELDHMITLRDEMERELHHAVQTVNALAR